MTQVNQYELRVANALWAEKTYPLSLRLSGRRSTTPTAPAARSRSISRATPKASGKRSTPGSIEQTNHRIRDLLPAGSIDALTRLVLTNAIYFKGEWAEPFDAGCDEGRGLPCRGRCEGARTDDAPSAAEGARYAAFNADGSFLATPRMITQDQAAQSNRDSIRARAAFLVAELPYKGGDLAMVAIVPQEASTASRRWKKSSPTASCKTWLGKLEAREVNVQFPKFKLETEYQMNDTLKKLGMARAFSPGDGPVRRHDNQPGPGQQAVHRPRRSQGVRRGQREGDRSGGRDGRGDAGSGRDARQHPLHAHLPRRSSLPLRHPRREVRHDPVPRAVDQSEGASLRRSRRNAHAAAPRLCKSKGFRKECRGADCQSAWQVSNLPHSPAWLIRKTLPSLILRVTMASS